MNEEEFLDLGTVEGLIKKLQQLEDQKATIKVKTPYGSAGIVRIQESFKDLNQCKAFRGYWLVLGD